MKISKSVREAVYKKCDGHCAYCGKPIEFKNMHVDHIQAKWHTLTDEQAERSKITKGTDDIENLNPTCVRCNRWKQTFTIEQFRNEISMQTTRLMKYNNNYRMAFDYGMIAVNPKPVTFYFETINSKP